MKSSYIATLTKDIELTKLFIRRDIAIRYKGSQLGRAWTVINPLLMLSVYTLVFSQIFRAKWGGSADTSNPINFALNLYAGLIIFNIFAECATRASTLITSNPNFVKKIRFPLHVLGEMVVGNSIFHAVINIAILLLAKWLTDGQVPSTVLFLPFIFTPIILMCLGITWLLAAIGVYFKDINQLITAVVSMLMFLSPIFYPATAMPESLKWLANLNPIAIFIEYTRRCVINGSLPSVGQLILETIVAAIWCEVAFRIHQRLKPNFGDYL